MVECSGLEVKARRSEVSVFGWIVTNELWFVVLLDVEKNERENGVVLLVSILSVSDSTRLDSTNVMTALETTRGYGG